MAEVTLELMFEALKKIQEGQARIIETQAIHSRQLLRMSVMITGLVRRSEGVHGEKDTEKAK